MSYLAGVSGNRPIDVRFAHHKYGQPLAVDASSFPRWTGIVPDGEPHVLDFHEFLVVSSGAANVVIDGRADRIAGRAVVFTPPGVLRRVEVMDPLALQLVVFSDQALRRAGWAARFRRLAAGPLRVREDVSLASLNSIMQLMRAELVSPARDSALMLEALLAQFMVTLDRSRSVPSADAPALVVRFDRHVERLFREHHDVATYAVALGCSVDHLSAVVRSHYGVSAKAVIDRRLLAEAARLLTVTRLPVADIAASLGFDEPSNFTRFFTRCAGQPPRRFRAAH